MNIKWLDGADPQLILNEIEEELIKKGLVFFKNIRSIANYKNLINLIGNIIPHRDSDETGLTAIRDVQNDSLGYRGFSNHSLSLHTDRSCLVRPPLIMTGWFSQTSANGGENIFLDGYQLYRLLLKHYVDILSILVCEQNIFNDQNNYSINPIFEKLNHNRMIIRYRNDDYVKFGKQTAQHIPLLDEIMINQAFEIKFNKFEGFILNNTRVLHGRKSFLGKREVFRSFVDPLNIKLEAGFSIN